MQKKCMSSVAKFLKKISCKIFELFPVYELMTVAQMFLPVRTSSTVFTVDITAKIQAFVGRKW